MFKLPVFNTVWGRAVERVVFLGAAAGLSDLASHLTTYNTGKFAALTPVLYFVLKSAVDFLNNNLPNA